ncbi:MAG: hypothetical protein RLZZ546_3121 [Bacteroidota bacterium]|jgi:hypothetical protein
MISVLLAGEKYNFNKSNLKIINTMLFCINLFKETKFL